MKIIVIGSVAAGTSVAAKARRNTEEAEIVVYDQGKDISYSVCGIPYKIGGEVESLDSLTPRNAKWFKKRYNVSVFTEHRVTTIDHEAKKLEVKEKTFKDKDKALSSLDHNVDMFSLLTLEGTKFAKKKKLTPILLWHHLCAQQTCERCSCWVAST